MEKKFFLKNWSLFFLIVCGLVKLYKIFGICYCNRKKDIAVQKMPFFNFYPLISISPEYKKSLTGNIMRTKKDIKVKFSGFLIHQVYKLDMKFQQNLRGSMRKFSHFMLI